MPPKKLMEKKRHSVDPQAPQEIRFRKNLDSCPPELKELFGIVVEVKHLKPDLFVGHKNNLDDSSVKLDARSQYNKELKSDSLTLNNFCNFNERSRTVESGWISGQKPVVFYRFNAEDEEQLARNRHQHCFICRKHYPVHSRPLLNKGSLKRIEIEMKGRLQDEDQHLCQLSSTKHFNFPDFNIVNQLGYLEFEDERVKIPDVTVGLRTYDLVEYVLNDEQRDNCRIRLFDRKLLQRLESEGYLKPLFIPPQQSKKFAGNFDLTFPFLLWEAKIEGGSSNHQKAQEQNAMKGKMLVQWQEDIANSAALPWFPLAWHFVSVGSEWRVYGCHFEEAAGGRIYSQTKLWSGDAAIEEEALQLLYIVDIVALWGQHMFKTFAGACIQRFEAKLENKELPPLAETMFADQLKLDRDTFPWLFPEDDNTKPSASLSKEDRKKTPESGQESQDGPERPKSAQLVTGMEKLRLTSRKHSSPKEYIVPERDCFIWLLDRDLGGKDLLIVRVSEEGVVLPPLVIFDSSDWKNREFRLILKDEEARRPDNMVVGFRQRRNGSSYMQECVQGNPGYLREAQIQFCAIIPLDYKSYERQLRSETAVLYRLEEMLGLSSLIEAAHNANARWCECRAVYNEYSPPLIRCDNLKCPLGWYHKKCMRLPDSFEAKLWLCKECTNRWNTNDNNDFEEPDIEDGEILEASDLRVQRLKSLSRVWKAHPWPKEEKVRKLVNRISCRININMKEKHDTVDEVDHKTSEEPQCWAVLRSNPKIMVPMTPLMRKVA